MFSCWVSLIVIVVASWRAGDVVASSIAIVGLFSSCLSFIAAGIDDDYCTSYIASEEAIITYYHADKQDPAASVRVPKCVEMSQKTHCDCAVLSGEW